MPNSKLKTISSLLLVIFILSFAGCCKPPETNTPVNVPVLVNDVFVVVDKIKNLVSVLWNLLR